MSEYKTLTKIWVESDVQEIKVVNSAGAIIFLLGIHNHQAWVLNNQGGYDSYLANVKIWKVYKEPKKKVKKWFWLVQEPGKKPVLSLFPKTEEEAKDLSQFASIKFIQKVLEVEVDEDEA